MNKKGVDLLHNVIIFIILNVVFFVALIFFVSWASAGTIITEQTYSKQIALIIDQAKPGSVVEIDVSDLLGLAIKNDFNILETISIDNDENRVQVRVIEGEGHGYNFFTKKEVLWGLDKKTGRLHLEISK